MDDPITQRTITPRQIHDFNEKLFHWILKDCPILVSTLSGDQMEIKGCDLSTVEQIAKEIQTFDQKKEYFRYEKIQRNRKVRCFRKLKKIFGSKNPLAKERAIAMFHLRHNADMLDVDVFKAYILLAIQHDENPHKPSLNLVFNDGDFPAIVVEPAGEYFGEGGGAAAEGAAAAEGGAADGGAADDRVRLI